MTAKVRAVITGLTICAVAVATLGSAKKPLEKQLKVKATAIWVVNLNGGSAVCFQEGEATHVGQFKAVGSAVWDLANYQILSGSGTVTGANGDVINWVIGENNSVVFRGGTGRFSLASGGFSTLFDEPTVLPGPEEGTIMLVVEYYGTGTITY